MKDLEELMAREMPAIAARENAACAKHWDHAGIDDQRSKNLVSAPRARHRERCARLDLMAEFVARNGPVTRKDIERILPVGKQVIREYARELHDTGRIRIEAVRDPQRKIVLDHVYHPVEAEA